MARQLSLVLCLWLAPAGAAEEMDLPTLLETFDWDLANAEVESTKLADGLYVLFGLGGNIAVSIGDQGTLIVDDQFPELIPQVNAELAKLGSKGVDFAINTHWHFDHAQGNLALGPAGTWIVSQANSRRMMQSSNVINLVAAKYRQEAYPDDALPVIAFGDRMAFHFNGQQIDLMHFGAAHTTGDAAIFFRGQNAVHLGDVFNNTGFPFIDADSGGDIDGMIAFCEAALAELSPDAIVIPGHGEVSDVSALSRYVAMLRTVRDRVAEHIAEGATLEEVLAAGPTADFEETYGPVSESLGFVDRVYTSLARKQH